MLADTIISNSIHQLMNTPGTECVMLGNARHMDAADSRTFIFPKSQTFCNFLAPVTLPTLINPGAI